MMAICLTILSLNSYEVKAEDKTIDSISFETKNRIEFVEEVDGNTYHDDNDQPYAYYYVYDNFSLWIGLIIRKTNI